MAIDGSDALTRPINQAPLATVEGRLGTALEKRNAAATALEEADAAVKAEEAAAVAAGRTIDTETDAQRKRAQAEAALTRADGAVTQARTDLAKSKQSRAMPFSPAQSQDGVSNNRAGEIVQGKAGQNVALVHTVAQSGIFSGWEAKFSTDKKLPWLTRVRNAFLKKTPQGLMTGGFTGLQRELTESSLGFYRDEVWNAGRDVDNLSTILNVALVGSKSFSEWRKKAQAAKEAEESAAREADEAQRGSGEPSATG